MRKNAARKKAPAARKPRAAEDGDGEVKDKELETVLTEITAEASAAAVEDWVSVDCPYCGERFDVHVTCEESGDQTMHHDCQVCCRPVALHVTNEDGEISVEASRS